MTTVTLLLIFLSVIYCRQVWAQLRSSSDVEEAFHLVKSIIGRFMRTGKWPSLDSVNAQCRVRFKEHNAQVIGKALLEFVQKSVSHFNITNLVLRPLQVIEELRKLLASLNTKKYEEYEKRKSKATTTAAPLTEKQPPQSDIMSVEEFNNILVMSKKHLAEISPEIFSRVVRKICSESNERTLVKLDVSRLDLMLLTGCQNETVSLKDGSSLWDSLHFMANRTVVVLVAGWSNSAHDTDIITAMSKAYRCRENGNFVILNLGKHIENLDELFNLDVREIGIALGDVLVALSELVPIENIHLIGHSVGAHVAAYAATKFRSRTLKSIKRITGLDPAGVCYKPGRRDEPYGLQELHAETVDLIHTTPGILGVLRPKGTIDFYPRNIAAGHHQPGCSTVLCSHARAWKYYVESVYLEYEGNFLSSGCRGEMEGEECLKPTTVMGYGLKPGLRGSYYLKVFAQPPYGREFSATDDHDADIWREKCGSCEMWSGT